jgi:hypothetical protein
VEPARLKVGEYLDQWLAGKAGLRSSTRRSYREHIDLYLRPGLGYIRLTDLRDTDIERLYTCMRQLGRLAEQERAGPLLQRLIEARNPGQPARTMIEKHPRVANPLVRRGAPGRDRTCDRRIRRVTDHAPYGFYLLHCFQSISLELLELP